MQVGADIDGEAAGDLQMWFVSYSSAISGNGSSSSLELLMTEMELLIQAMYVFMIMMDLHG